MVSGAFSAAESNVLQDITYTYDAVGNITKIIDVSGTQAAKVVLFGYDDLYRLTTASTTAASSTPFAHTYSYTSIGNFSSSTPSGAYTYGETGYTNPHAPTNVGGTTLGYDANGNLTSYGTDTYGFDYRNRMASSTVSSLGATYGYDHTNQRVIKTNEGISTIYPNKYFDKENATTSKYIWAGDDLIATVTGNGSATSTEYVHADHLGSTNVTTNDQGEVNSVLDYLPFGSERISTGEELPGRGYIAQFTDREQDLLYLQNRYYSSDRGQFISQDPVFWEIGQTSDGKMVLANPQLQNSYSYAGNNPITGKDPTGRVVYLYSRPVDMPWGYVGAHSFVQVVPDNPATVGNIANVDTSKPFTLSGLPNNDRLQKFANTGADPSFTSCGASCGSSRVTVAPPQGVTSEQFDSNVVNSYNNLPNDLGTYWFWGSPKILGMPNSNNFTTSLLTNAGVSKDSLREYQNTLSQGNGKITPGFGTSALSPSYASQIKSQLTSIRNQLRDIVKKLQGN